MGALWADPDLCLELFPYCTAKVNSQGCTPTISSTGTPSASHAGSFRIWCHQVISRSPGMLVYSKTGTDAVPFYGGVLCIASPVKRTSGLSSGGNPPPKDCTGVLAFEFNDFIASGKDPDLILGQTVWAQYWYRDTQHPDGTGVGLSDALQFMICQ